MCRELEVNGTIVPTFHTDEFILKVTVKKLIEKPDRLIEKLIEKASINGDKLTKNKIYILKLIAEDPYISKSDLSKNVGINTAAISNNIKAMRDKYLRRVGPDKGGFWEIIE